MKKLFGKLRSSPKSAQLAFWVMLWTGFLICVLSAVFDDALWLLIAGAAVVALALLVMVVFWRCPKCGKPLPIHGSAGFDFCPYCGEEIF